jgi:rSAM/selenodomain-associated transferase 1
VDAVDNRKQKSAIPAVLGIFAKQPLAGKCKTRLSPPLSLQQAADLYQCSLQETVSRMQSGCDCDLVICYAGNRDWFAETFPGIELVPQQGDDLGARMANALQGFLRQGYQGAVLIGSDSPDLPVSLVEDAFAALKQTEVVLAPADDGGYVLIGESLHHPQLFTEIEWSTAEVLAETWQRIKQNAIPAKQLTSWDDLDDLPSLERFLQRSPDTRTAEYLRRHLHRHFSAGRDVSTT